MGKVTLISEILFIDPLYAGQIKALPDLIIKIGNQGKDELSISIEDNGPGIPSDQIDKVFEPYLTTKEKGTGLGLAIVKHNTELYGGTVSVDSELGNYTRFNLLFPGRSAMRFQS